MAEADNKMFMESAIPLILIIILGVFLLAKFNVINLSGIPIVGGLFPAQVIKIATIGHLSPGLAGYLNSDEFRQKGVIILGEYRQDELQPGILKEADLIILQNEPVCDRTAREVISKRVKEGAKLVLIGDTCTRVTGDESVFGWDLGIDLLGNIVPVTVDAPYRHEQIPSRKIASVGKFKIVSPTHPLFSSIRNLQYDGTLPGAQVFLVLPKADSSVLAVWSMSPGGESVAPSYRMMIESSSLLGKAVYFAYDPASQPTWGRNIFLNTILYLVGRSG